MNRKPPKPPDPERGRGLAQVYKGRKVVILEDGLTARQREILDLIEGYIAVHRYPPAVRDIMDMAGIFSPNGILCHLHALEKKGFIRRDPMVARSIVPTGKGTTPCIHCGGTGRREGP